MVNQKYVKEKGPLVQDFEEVIIPGIPIQKLYSPESNTKRTRNVFKAIGMMKKAEEQKLVIDPFNADPQILEKIT